MIAQAEVYAQQTGKAIHWLRAADFIQRKGGLPARAETAARRAIELAQQSPQADDAIAAQAYVALSRTQSAGGKIEEAIGSATRATELAPQDAAAWHHLGELLSGQQVYGAAATAFHKALEISDTHFASYRSLSIALERQQKLSEARAVLNRALAMVRGGPWAAVFQKALSELEPIGKDQSTFRGSGAAS